MNESEIRRLVELINDERARRAFAEKELADQRRQTAQWRRRARVAETAARFSLRIPQRRQPQQPAAEPPPRRRIVFPSIRVAVAGTPDWLDEAFDTVPLLHADEAALTGLDLVVVGAGAVAPQLESWLKLPSRQPLVAFDPSGDLASLLASTGVDLAVGETPVPATRRIPRLAPVVLDQPEGPLDNEAVLRRIVGARKRTVYDAGAALLREVGIEPPRKRLSVTAIGMTKRPHRVEPLVETLKAMDLDGLTVFLATHGFEAGSEVRKLGEALFGERIRFFAMPDQAPLGRCLNELVEKTTTEAWAKIDDDDYYGPRYMEEALLELERTGADMVGKLTHHLYDTHLDKTYLMHTGNEYTRTSYVPGPTFVARRHTWEEVRFPHRGARVDSIFIRGMNALGMSIYSTSRFEFAYGRGQESHTWQVEESYYEAKGRVLGDGFLGDAIFLPRES